MLLQMLQLLSLFDWATPALAAVDGLQHGEPLVDAWTFFIPMSKAIQAGWAPDHISELMSAYGIKTWSHLTFFDTYMFTVPLNKAAWAEYCLSKHQVPFNAISTGAPR